MIHQCNSSQVLAASLPLGTCAWWVMYSVRLAFKPRCITNIKMMGVQINRKCGEFPSSAARQDSVLTNCLIRCIGLGNEFGLETHVPRHVSGTWKWGELVKRAKLGWKVISGTHHFCDGQFIKCLARLFASLSGQLWCKAVLHPREWRGLQNKSFVLSLNTLWILALP